MGTKYSIRYIKSGFCNYEFTKNTNNIFVALWWLFTLSIRYPIIDFNIRHGYTVCKNCDATYCEKSPKYKPTVEIKK